MAENFVLPWGCCFPRAVPIQRVTVTSSQFWCLLELSHACCFFNQVCYWVRFWQEFSWSLLQKSQPEWWCRLHTTRVLTGNSRKQSFCFCWWVLSEMNPIMKNPRIDYVVWTIRGNPPPLIYPPPTNPTPTPPSSLSDKSMQWFFGYPPPHSPPISVTSVLQPTHYWQAFPCFLNTACADQTGRLPSEAGRGCREV